MNQDRLNTIDKILMNSGVRLRESYFKNNHKEIYLEIIKFCEKLDISFKEKVWHWVNDKDEYFLCKCGSRTTLNKNWMHGYRKYCSHKCAAIDGNTKEKRKATVLEKYGVDNVAKLEETKFKQEVTNKILYGYKSSFQNEVVRKKWRDGIMNKWGFEHVFQLKFVKDKSRITSLEKYNKEHFVQSLHYKDKLEQIGFSDKLRNLNFQKHQRKYIEMGLEFIQIDNRILKLSSKCGHIFDIHYDSLKRRIDYGYDPCTICNPINSGQSQEEKLLIDWIKSQGLDVIEKDRRFGFELDIFIESKKIAIEFNGLYWHSEIYKNKSYHYEKWEICNKNNIRLINIWEDDWLYKKDIVKSIILNSLGQIRNKIWSRNCRIVAVNNASKNLFLDVNHIQGKCQSKINIGLEYNGEIVSLMTFGIRNINKKPQYELIRFCNKIETIVVGAASKLLNYFKNNYDFETIYSYADISYFSGNLYKNLGFEYLHRTSPNYWWVVGGIRYHRFTYNKKRLVKEGADPEKTEVEIMYNLGYYRIFGCGQDKYLLKR